MANDERRAKTALQREAAAATQKIKIAASAKSKRIQPASASPTLVS